MISALSSGVPVPRGRVHRRCRESAGGVRLGHRASSSISSGSSRAASRQRASAARAYSRRRPGQPAGRGDHHLRGDGGRPGQLRLPVAAGAGRAAGCCDSAGAAGRATGQPIRRHSSTTRAATAAAAAGDVRRRGLVAALDSARARPGLARPHGLWPGRGPRAWPGPRREDPQARLDHLGQRLLLPAAQLAEVDPGRRRARAGSSSERYRRSRSSAPGRARPAAASTARSPVSASGGLDRADPVQPAGARHLRPPAPWAGRARPAGAGAARRGPGSRTSATWAATPSASEAVRSATAPGSASAGSWLRASSIGGRQRPRPADLDLQCAPVAVGDLLQRVQVAGQQGLGPAQVAAGPVGEPPALGGELDGQLDQQRRGPAGQVGAGAAAGQFGQVREVGQLIEDQPDRLGGVGAGHRADTGRALRRPRVGGGMARRAAGRPGTS